MNRKSMSSPLGKKILSIVREGDYAHPGEDESVEMVFKRYDSTLIENVLDVGCGRGGTSDKIRELGFKKVYGFDIDKETISYAKTKYPHIDFRVLDAVSCAEEYNQKFDIICMFNVFYALKKESQNEFLRNATRISFSKSDLVIFDYSVSDVNCYDDKSGLRSHWNPINVKEFPSLAKNNGWGIKDFADISEEYFHWYTKLVQRIDLKKDVIVSISDEDWFKYARSLYDNLRKDIEGGVIGGSLIYLTPL